MTRGWRFRWMVFCCFVLVWLLKS